MGDLTSPGQDAAHDQVWVCFLGLFIQPRNAGNGIDTEYNLILAVVIEIEREGGDVGLRHIGVLQRSDDPRPVDAADPFATSDGSLASRIPLGTAQPASRI